MKPSSLQGQTTAEYILVIGLIAIALLLLFSRFRKPTGHFPNAPLTDEKAR